MKISNYEHIDKILLEFASDVKKVLDQKISGLYVYGSLVWGDFDEGISDIDLMAALTDDISDEELIKLREMHENFVNRHPDFEDRIEVQYVKVSDIKEFKTKRHQMINISPGEPIHRIEAGSEWFMNWYLVITYGKTIFGPTPSTFIPHLTKEEFIAATIEQAKYWQTHIENARTSRPYQGYVVMTLCRALYTVTYGEQVSKKKAADWVATQFPRYADLIADTFIWREQVKDKNVDDSLTYPIVKQFVEHMIERICS